VAVPFWRKTDQLAGDHDVKVAIEMHPQNLVFSPPTLLELVERTGATHLGAEMDPSHLFWQGWTRWPPSATWGRSCCMRRPRTCASTRTRASTACSTTASGDLSPDEDCVSLGGQEYVNEWPADSAWDFVALGRGHDVDFWARFLQALHDVDPQMAVHIEHEDTSLGRIGGLGGGRLDPHADGCGAAVSRGVVAGAGHR
jgi:sugar phosphate isomerase/epimerase